MAVVIDGADISCFTPFTRPDITVGATAGGGLLELLDELALTLTLGALALGWEVVEAAAGLATAGGGVGVRDFDVVVVLLLLDAGGGAAGVWD